MIGNDLADSFQKSSPASSSSYSEDSYPCSSSDDSTTALSSSSHWASSLSGSNVSWELDTFKPDDIILVID